MNKNIALIVQSEEDASNLFKEHFRSRGYEVFTTTNRAEAHTILAENDVDIALIDLHVANNEWDYLIAHINNSYPDTHIICTNNYPVLQREYRAQELGVSVFLRKPFTSKWIDTAIAKLEKEEEEEEQEDDNLPKVRIPVRMKITFPYALLALLLAIGAAYVVSQIVLESVESRFKSQLVEAGTLSADWVTNEERRLLTTLRLLAFTNGLPEAIEAADSEALREFILPVAINNKEEAVDILDLTGKSILSLHHNQNGDIADYSDTRGETIFAEWEFVQKVLNGVSDESGDKFAGVATAPWGDYLYVSGPIFNEANELVGVILVGTPLTLLAREMQSDIVAQISFYDLNGQQLASTFFQGDVAGLTATEQSEILLKQDEITLVRNLTGLGSVDYSEILGPFELRSGADVGYVGSAKPQTFLVETSSFTQVQIFVFVTLAFILIIFVGVFLANRITKPLVTMMEASRQVAQGNLAVSVDARGDDEVAVLAHSFNRMVSGLREGSMYRDLLGRTVSLEVREQMRKSFSSGEVLLEGQDAMATVVMSDIRGFTTMSENYEPKTILSWLNEFFGEVVPVITNYGGVVNKFEGDAVMSFFGIIPRKLSAQESASLGCQVAIEMLKKIEDLNVVRLKRGEPAFIAGIGVNTGIVTAGGLGASDRLHYTIIGDVVNTTARLETFTRQLTVDCCAVISDSTMEALAERASDYNLVPVGQHVFKGKTVPMQVYRLWPNNQDMSKVEASVFDAHSIVKHTEK